MESMPVKIPEPPMRYAIKVTIDGQRTMVMARDLMAWRADKKAERLNRLKGLEAVVVPMTDVRDVKAITCPDE